MVFVAKNGLRSDLRVYNSWREHAPVPLADACTECACYVHALNVPCCAHVTCSSSLRHCQ